MSSMLKILKIELIQFKIPNPPMVIIVGGDGLRSGKWWGLIVC